MSMRHPHRVDADRWTITFDSKARAEIDGKPATLDALPKGGKVGHLPLSVDRKTLAALVVTAK